ncbi:MAG: hypothetical protein ABIL25_04480 [candidate division WOR-3 bacterium]
MNSASKFSANSVTEAREHARYHHTQFGYLTVFSLAGAVVLIVGLTAIAGFNWVALVTLIVLTVCAGLFATLTVTVYQDRIVVKFGPGLIRRQFLLKEISSCRAVTNRWYYGWGIRLIPRGMLYNVSGLQAVELEMKNSRRYRIGTDAPDALTAAIRQSLK